jgi:twinkle protein
VIISEGEIDALSWAEAGVSNSFSVPTGASVSEQEKGWLWLSREVFDQSERIILALDNDEPGQAAAEEIARRIGKHRGLACEYPDGCKDANDVLTRHGKDRLVKVYESAQPWPVTGLYDTNHYTQQVYDLIEKGDDAGLSTGLTGIDEIYRVGTGQLVMVTGIPGSGKSRVHRPVAGQPRRAERMEGRALLVREQSAGAHQEAGREASARHRPGRGRAGQGY